MQGDAVKESSEMQYNCIMSNMWVEESGRRYLL
jgi:hypothetical protein